MSNVFDALAILAQTDSMETATATAQQWRCVLESIARCGNQAEQDAARLLMEPLTDFIAINHPLTPPAPEWVAQLRTIADPAPLRLHLACSCHSGQVCKLCKPAVIEFYDRLRQGETGR